MRRRNNERGLSLHSLRRKSLSFLLIIYYFVDSFVVILCKMENYPEKKIQIAFFFVALSSGLPRETYCEQVKLLISAR